MSLLVEQSYFAAATSRAHRKVFLIRPSKRFPTVFELKSETLEPLVGEVRDKFARSEVLRSSLFGRLVQLAPEPGQFLFECEIAAS